MKTAYIYIGIAILAFGCGKEPFRPQQGDLLFQAGKGSQMELAISDATATEAQINFTHVAIAIRNGGRDSVLEASSEGGVRLCALEDFLDGAAKIGEGRAVEVKRLTDTTGLAAAIRRARDYIGQPYDYSFLPDNGKMYCSELVWASYLRPNGASIFSTAPMNFRATDGRMPEFWVELFERLGEPIPEGVPGTNPNDLAKEPTLKSVHRYF